MTDIRELTQKELDKLSGLLCPDGKLVNIRTFQQLKDLGIVTNPIECKPMDEEWKQRIAEKKWWANANRDKVPTNKIPIRKFMDKLLEFGGEEVCISSWDMFDDLCVIDGQFWFGKDFNQAYNKDFRCHTTTVDLWEILKSNRVICNGFALTDDGVWRQHTWIIHLDIDDTHENIIKREFIEPHSPKIAYYGICMNSMLSESYAKRINKSKLK